MRADMMCARSSALADGASLYDEKNTSLTDAWLRSTESALETAVERELSPPDAKEHPFTE